MTACLMLTCCPSAPPFFSCLFLQKYVFLSMFAAHDIQITSWWKITVGKSARGIRIREGRTVQGPSFWGGIRKNLPDTSQPHGCHLVPSLHARPWFFSRSLQTRGKLLEFLRCWSWEGKGAGKTLR